MQAHSNQQLFMKIDIFSIKRHNETGNRQNGLRMYVSQHVAPQMSVLILSIGEDSVNMTDRRIAKSKKALQEALVKLMKRKNLKEITVTDIVRTANLNRGTFYKHYQYKEDILTEILDEVIADLIASYREPYKGKETFEVGKLTSSAIKVFDHVGKYADFYSLIVQSDALSGLQHQICRVLKQLTLQDFAESLPRTRICPELHASYQSYALLGLIIEWVSGGMKYSPNDMAEQFLEILKIHPAESVVKPKIGHTYNVLE